MTSTPKLPVTVTLRVRTLKTPNTIGVTIPIATCLLLDIQEGDNVEFIINKIHKNTT